VIHIRKTYEFTDLMESVSTNQMARKSPQSYFKVQAPCFKFITIWNSTNIL